MSTPDFLATLCRRLRRSLWTQGTAHLHEARCAWILAAGIPHFVFACEGAVVDAGVLVLPFGKELPENPSDRLDYALEHYVDSEILISIDFKICNITLYSPGAGPVGMYRIGASDEQRQNLALFIIVNPETPAWLAVVPRSLMDKGGYNLRDTPFNGIKLDAYPPEFYAFVVPQQQLVAAVIEWLRFHANPEQGWRNPHTGIVIRGLPQLQLQNVRLLSPVSGLHIKDFNIEQRLRKAFQTYSSSYCVERLFIRPSVGDFQIRHLSTSQRVVVELKRNLAVHIWQKHSIKHQPRLKTSDLRIFTPLCHWDFLLSVLENEESALFISRDDIPDHWFQEDIKSTSFFHTWEQSDGPLACHMVPWKTKDMSLVVGRLEVILNRHLSTGLRARRRHPFIVPSATECELMWDKSMHEATQVPLIVRPLRGAGAFPSQRQYEGQQERFLHLEIDRHNFGALLRYGYHPSGTHAFVLGQFSKPPNHHDLALHSPLIFLNFARVNYTDLHSPDDAARAVLFYLATHGKRGSLFVLSPTMSMEAQGINRFVVASGNLDTPDRRLVTDRGVLCRSRTMWRNAHPINLADGSRLDTWAVPEFSLVPYLEHVLRRWCHSPTHKSQLPTTDFSKLADSRLQISLNDLVHSNIDAIHDTIDMAFTSNYWSFAIRRVGLADYFGKDDTQPGEASEAVNESVQEIGENNSISNTN